MYPKKSYISLYFISIVTSYAQNHFVTTWNTEAGDAGNSSVTLPVLGGAYDVDVGNDGAFEVTDHTGRLVIDLVNPGTYTFAIRPNVANTENELQIRFANNSKPKKLISMENWGGGGDIVWTSMDNAFQGCSNMNIAANAGVPNLSKVTDMSYMFSGASNLNSDLSTWNVANVTDMTGMFNNTESFNGDISTWNVENVTNMNFMFILAANFNGDLSTWNVSKVTNMNFMFWGATAFSTQNYEKLLSGWSEHTLQNGVTFTAPSVSYCFGKAVRNILTGTYGWTISGDNLDPNCLDLSIAADALLQGPYNSTTGLMSDDLRTGGATESL